MNTSVFVCLSMLLLTAVSAYADEHYYYYHKNKMPLELDVSRVAMLEQTEPAVRPDAALQAMGLEPANTEAHALKGWWVSQVPLSRRRPQDVEQIVTSVVAKRKEPAFASPVYTDRYGHPILITPDILVGFRKDTAPERMAAILEMAGIDATSNQRWPGMPHIRHLRTRLSNGLAVLQAANKLSEHPEVEFAEPDFVFTARADLTPNDPLFGDLWGIHNTGQEGGTSDADMDGPEAWNYTTGDSGITVVVLDTGVDLNHPDLVVADGADFTGEGGAGGPVNACDNHGTAVAGCISATINNSIGIVGIAPGCQVASARIGTASLACDGTWSGQASWTVDALSWAETIGAKVTNNSNSYGTRSAAINAAYADTLAAGILHFASAGNDGGDDIAYPADLLDVIAIGALDRDGNVAEFSNWPPIPQIILCAPGVDITLTDRAGAMGYATGDYTVGSGTSYASPYAAGVAALVLSLYPPFDPGTVREILFWNKSGFCSTNAYEALHDVIHNVLSGTTWIDFNHIGSENGSCALPFNTLAEAVAAAPTNGRIRIHLTAGSHSSNEVLTITKPVTIDVWHGGEATIGR